MTTSTLRPNGVQSFAGASASSGTMDGCTSDNSDATYVTIGSGGRYLALTLGTVSLPAGAVTKSLTLRVRAAGGPGGDFDCYAAPPGWTPKYADVTASSRGASRSRQARRGP